MYCFMSYITRNYVNNVTNVTLLRNYVNNPHSKSAAEYRGFRNGSAMRTVSGPLARRISELLLRGQDSSYEH